MSRHVYLSVAAATLAWLGAMDARADRQLSPDLIDQYDQAGYLTPNFKAAIHAYVDASERLDQATAQQLKSQVELPAMQRDAADAEAKVAALRGQLSLYDHPDESDFTALEAKVHDPAAKPEDIIALAQAYVWTYPASPHAADAQAYLSNWSQKLADQVQAEKEAEAARIAAHEELVRRAEAHDLNLTEWRDFLRGMSQDDLVKLFGQPSSRQDDYWYYDGAWVVNPDNAPKAGLQINFEAGRVINVDAKPPSP
jgi:hypothetical protein